MRAEGICIMAKQEQTASGKKGFSLFQYFEDSKAELAKVSWPTKKEVKVTFLAVIVLVLVTAVFLGIVDTIWAALVRLVFSIGAGL